MSVIDPHRPRKLYRYSERHWLERSLSLGEFRLRPPGLTGPVAQQQPVLALSLAREWNERLFDLFAGADSCLVIHDTEEFGERIHRAAKRILPSWAGIDAAVSYGSHSPLGAVFSKARCDAAQKEWMFAWRPTQFALSLNPVFIQIGNIEDIAELRDRGAGDALLH